MVRAVKAENTVDAQLKIAASGNLPFEPVRRENNFGEFVAFENLSIHAPVAAVAAAIATGGVHDDLTLGFARRWVEANRSVLECECSVDRVEIAAESEFHLGVIGIKLERKLLRTQRRRENNSQNKN